MANITEYKKQIINHVIATIKDSASGLGYQVTKFYNTESPEALYNFIKGRLNTVDGTVFCRMGDTDYTPIDTQALMYNVDFTIEIICASIQVIKENQLPDTDRHTDEMLTNVRNELLTNPLTLQGRPQRYVVGGDVSLFRSDNADAQLLRMQIQNINVEF